MLDYSYVKQKNIDQSIMFIIIDKHQNEKSFFLYKQRNKIKEIKRQNGDTNWTKEQDELLIQLSITEKRKNWDKIVSLLKGKSKRQCKSRLNKINPKIKRGKWSAQEDNQLLD